MFSDPDKRFLLELLNQVQPVIRKPGETIFGTTANVQDGQLLTDQENLIYLKVPMGVYSVMVRHQLPAPSITGVAGQFFGTRAVVAWGIDGAFDFVFCDAFPYAIVPVVGDTIAIKLGREGTPVGRNQALEERVSVTIAPGLSPWQATRTVPLPDPIANGVAEDVTPPAYATHVRVSCNSAHFVAGNALRFFSQQGVQLFSQGFNALQTTMFTQGIRLLSDVSLVRVANGSGVNLSAASLVFTLSGVVGQP